MEESPSTPLGAKKLMPRNFPTPNRQRSNSYTIYRTQDDNFEDNWPYFYDSRRQNRKNRVTYDLKNI